MALDQDDASTERRQAPAAPRHGGRRYRDDPDLAAAVERQQLHISKDFNALRDAREWSQQDLASVTGIAQSTIQQIEKAGADVRLSTLVRWAFACGFELDIRIRRLPRAHRLIGVNHSISATSP